MNKIILRRQRITKPDTLGTLEEKMKKHIILCYTLVGIHD